MQRDTRTHRPVCEAARVRAGGYSQGVEEAAVDFGVEQAFGKAAHRLARHYPVRLSETTVRKLTLKAAAKAGEFEKPGGTVGALPARGAGCVEAQADGTMVPVVGFGKGGGDRRKLRACHWREQRLCVARAQGKVEAHYGCAMGSLEELGRKWSECGKKAGWGLESEVHAIGDGAEWVGRKASEVFGPRCRMLVDFYHVSDYLGKVGREHPALKGRRGWLKCQQNRLKKGKHRRVIGELKRLAEGGEVPDEEAPARCAHRYLGNRADQLWYDEAIALGRSIGSGLVEGSHRHVLQHRLKLSGAWWLPENAEAMSQLRVLRANNRFHEIFPLAS